MGGLDRRNFIKTSTLSALSIKMDMSAAAFTPAAEKKAGTPLSVFNKIEQRTLEKLGEILLPGAAEAGIAHYIDHQISSGPEESLLFLRYMDQLLPPETFYRQGLKAVNDWAQAEHGCDFSEVPSGHAEQFVRSLSRESSVQWKGPPASLFYFVLRTDVVDVVYGTMEGFRKLGIPYMEHIKPPTPW